MVLVPCSSLPFKGRVGVGMGLILLPAITNLYPIPLLTSPLQGEEENHFLLGHHIYTGEKTVMDKLYLSETDKKIGGVCGGIGEFFGKDATLFRILFILLILFSFGVGVIAYLAMWLVIPKRPQM